MTAYYNDNDPKVVAVLRELIKRGLIADGIVDDRSILDVEPVDLAGFDQCHFFAGIGGWSYAARLAGLADTAPIWTGSPPCQPFSVAGRQIGRDDPRHLAPKFASLVRAGRPVLLFGEQVASSEVFGKVAGKSVKRAAEAPGWTWLDDLSNRLEAAGYAVGASDLPAAGVGAPHIRQRCFFGAVRLEHTTCDGWLQWRPRSNWWRPVGGCSDGGLADIDSGERGRVTDGPRRKFDGSKTGWQQSDGESECGGTNGGVADINNDRPQGRLPGWPDAEREGLDRSTRRDGATGGLADNHGRNASPEWQQRGGEHGLQPIDGQSGSEPERTRPDHDPWRDADWLFCRDERWRPVEPRSFPLAHGLPARVGRLRGYGNAIVPQVAAAFIEAFMEGLNQ